MQQHTTLHRHSQYSTGARLLRLETSLLLFLNHATMMMTATFSTDTVNQNKTLHFSHNQE